MGKKVIKEVKVQIKPIDHLHEQGENDLIG